MVTLSEMFLIVAAFFTSMTTAIAGIGGGVMLIALMPGFLPVAAIIPVHGVVQISSNISRVFLGLRHIEWRLIWQYLAGAVVGVLLGSQLVLDMQWDMMPLFLGIFILITTWMPRPSGIARFPFKFVILGAFQTALSLFVGVSGPMNMPFLLRENLDRDRTVITHATQMTMTHTLKVGLFGVLGFAFGSYSVLIIGMIASATLGSYIGTKVRGHVPEEVFKKGLKVLITVLSLRMIVRVLM
ncbi:MAG: putative membrane protein YfcA [Candidatus Latescibacterota bacterium]|jgi:uncharacterized membrane protein YfcA